MKLNSILTSNILFIPLIKKKNYFTFLALVEQN